MVIHSASKNSSFHVIHFAEIESISDPIVHIPIPIEVKNRQAVNILTRIHRVTRARAPLEKVACSST